MLDRNKAVVATERSARKEPFSDEEVETLVEMRRDEGTLAPSESELIQDVIRLGNKTTKDCMTPRTDTFMISSEWEPEDAVEKVRGQEDWHWRVPVYDDTPDVVVGTLDVKEWLQNPGAPFMPFVSPPVFVGRGIFSAHPVPVALQFLGHQHG